jgi:hypothetical protein
MKYKNLQIDPEIHHKFQVHCVTKKEKLRYVTERIILEYLEKYGKE